LTGKGALGKWRTQEISTAGHSAGITGQKAIRCLTVDITMQFRGVCRQVLKFRSAWEGSSAKCCCCQPYSGKPTVRDERGASGNVDDCVVRPSEDGSTGTRLTAPNLGTSGAARHTEIRRSCFKADSNHCARLYSTRLQAPASSPSQKTLSASSYLLRLRFEAFGFLLVAGT
jgi:hypothetical protein